MTRGDRALKRLTMAHLCELRAEVDLDRGQRGEGDIRQVSLEAREEFLVVLEGVLLGHPADDVQLGDAEARKLGCAVDQLVDAVGVGARVLVGPDRKRAEPASDDANVCRVEVCVDVVGHLVAVPGGGGGRRGGAEVFEGCRLEEGEGVGGGDSLTACGGSEHAVNVSH